MEEDANSWLCFNLNTFQRRKKKKKTKAQTLQISKKGVHALVDLLLRHQYTFK